MISESRALFAPKIYYFHPLLAGTRLSWPHQLRRIRNMGFDHILTAPIFAPGSYGDIFLTGDHDRLNAAFGDGESADAAFVDLAQAARREGLGVLTDIVVGRMSTDASLAQSHPRWFQSGDTSGFRVDPRYSLRQGHAAYLRFDQPSIASEITTWWIERLVRLAKSGVAGFRCIEPHLVPSAVWRDVIGVVQGSANCRFLAWTPGISWSDLAQLRGVGFTAAFSSLPWWDGRSGWLVEEHELLRSIGAVTILTICR
jgi:starch synthase (maltosyl-transferring)